MPNERIVVQRYTDRDGRECVFRYADNSIWLDIAYRGRNIMAAREFRITDFPNVLSPQKSPDYELRGPWIEQVTDSCVLFTMGAYMPETDAGWSIGLAIFKDGTFSYEEVVYPFGDD